MSYFVGSAGFAGGKLKANILALTYPNCKHMAIKGGWEATAAKTGYLQRIPRMCSCKAILLHLMRIGFALRTVYAGTERSFIQAKPNIGMPTQYTICQTRGRSAETNRTPTGRLPNGWSNIKTLFLQLICPKYAPSARTSCIMSLVPQIGGAM